MEGASGIRQHMDLIGADGVHVGTVDAVDSDGIKLTRHDAPDGRHHQIPLSAVARVDDRVHLNVDAAAALALVQKREGPAAAKRPIPPLKNPAVSNSKPRRNYYLPWVLGILALVVIGLLINQFAGRREAAANNLTLPNGRMVAVLPNTLNYEMQRFLASDEPAPRTFTFDALEFDTGSAKIRSADQAGLDTLAQILAAYPDTRVQVVGYTDARGDGKTNADLGRQRANAVAGALIAKGVSTLAIQPVSGGELNPRAANETAQGRAENRRTEMVVLEK